MREKYGFPWAQSTAYRVSFLKPGVLGGIDPAAFVDTRYQQTLAETSIRPGLPATERRMRQMVNLNFKWFMQTLLDRKDRMSMYSGLEVRVPFCDYRIAEYLYSVPWEFKDWGGQEKGLLREAMRGVLPDEVLWRRKAPTPKPGTPATWRRLQPSCEVFWLTPPHQFCALSRPTHWKPCWRRARIIPSHGTVSL